MVDVNDIMKRTFICLLVAFVSATAAAPAVEPSATEITASGTGSIVMQPNVATVSAVVETNADNATDAVSQNNVIYDRVVAAVVKLGVARNDVALDNYYVSYTARPNDAQVRSGPERYGYNVSRRFSVKVRSIGKAGNVSDACLAAGATGINGIDFGVSDTNAAHVQATAKAVADARANAQALAAAAGLHVVAIKSMQFGGEFAGPGLKTIARVAARPATEFDQSPVNVTSTVTIVFIARP